MTGDLPFLEELIFELYIFNRVYMKRNIFAKI